VVVDREVAMQGQRTLVWLRDGAPGAELCTVLIENETLVAAGTQLGSDPVAYRMDYRIVTGPGFEVRSVEARVGGEAGERSLRMERAPDGSWRVDGAQPGVAHELEGAEEVDLAFSPLTATVAIRRLGLFQRPGEQRTVRAAWVGVPGLYVTQAEDRYAVVDAATGLVRYDSGPVSTDLLVDAQGFVARFPGVAHLAS
jgi:uncharacterized protein